MASVCILTGIVFIAYFLCIELFTGHGTNFYFIWLFTGLVLVLYGFAERKGLLTGLPGWIRKGTGFLVLAGLIALIAVEGMIISGFFHKAEKGLDYIIVLGAQLKPEGPSRVLQLRLDAAYEYLTENADTVAIVSGGQGSNEPDTEAQGMHDYLVQKGIPSSRIIKEDRSVNTTQNIQFSSAFLDQEKDSVGIVTNTFHIFRAVQLAKAAGYKDVSGVVAPSNLFLQPNNMLREFFGVVKDFLAGNLM